MNRFYIFFLLTFIFSACYNMRSSNGGGQTDNAVRTLDIGDVVLAPGYQIDAIATDLTFPSAVTFDEAGNLYVIETGYSYGEVFLQPRLIKLNNDGTQQVIATGEKNGPWTNVVHHNGNFYVSEGGQLEGGKILKISPQGQITTLIDSLPGFGDHHTNAVLIGPDNNIYFAQGTATNSGVVGNDNYDFGWLKRFPQFHDIPCKDITLTGQNFTTPNVITDAQNDKATTGAFVPYGTNTSPNQVIRGSVPCCGAVMRMSLTGSNLEVVAWGFRNPFGLAFAPNDSLYVMEHGYDARGSRPVWGAGDY
ncbi:MAG: glucose dehydrogenase, partial [Saprospiraceae bacterium]